MKRGLAFALLALVVLARPSVAAAEGWPWPVDGRVVLAYGVPYEVAGQTRVHRGADVQATAGSRVLSPGTAVVAFAGRVPVEDGTSRLAVSLDLPDGLRVTVMPLEDVGVVAGQELTAGDMVGRLAAEGDPSCAAPHLHVGLRRCDAYLDPATLFTGVAAAVDPPPPGPGRVPSEGRPRGTETRPPPAPGLTAPTGVNAVAPAAIAAPSAAPEGVLSPMADADPLADTEADTEACGRRTADTSVHAARVDAPMMAAAIAALVAAAMSVGAVRRRFAGEGA